MVKLDVVEARVLTGTDDLERAALVFEEWGSPETVITRADGVLARVNGKTYWEPFSNRSVVGRTGRGDTTFAAYMARRLDHDPDESLKFAAALVSLKMEKAGPFDGTLADVLERMNAGRPLAGHRTHRQVGRHRRFPFVRPESAGANMHMPKTPIDYFSGDPWTIVEEGFDPAYQRVSESVFSVGNEFMGVRGYFEEGYSGDHLLGSYFNHLYELMDICHDQLFKGFVTQGAAMLNAVDWLYTRLAGGRRAAGPGEVCLLRLHAQARHASGRARSRISCGRRPRASTSR
jgi:hypothetical protein